MALDAEWKRTSRMDLLTKGKEEVLRIATVSMDYPRPREPRRGRFAKRRLGSREPGVILPERPRRRPLMARHSSFCKMENWTT